MFGSNTSGQVVGSYLDTWDRFHGFVRDQRGRFTDIDVPRAEMTVATRTDDTGRIVGVYSDEDDTPALQAEHGFLLHQGRFTEISAPGAPTGSTANDINDNGHVVGTML